jgi:ribosomal protein S18 acetylase RimI-like enzyme
MTDQITQLQIREAGHDDAEIVAAIIRAAFAPQAAMIGVTAESHPHYAAFQPPEQVRDWMLRGERVLLAEAGGVAVGTITFGMKDDEPGVGFLKRLAVLPAHRGRMYGDALMARAEADLTSQGAVEVELAIVAEFTRLQSFYERHGYRLVTVKHYAHFPADVGYMRKPAHP